MSTESILSQEEIDALLDKADSVAQKRVHDGLKDEVSSYDIFNPPVPKASALPNVEPLMDRLTERLAGCFEGPLAKLFTLADSPDPELIPFAEFRQTLESPTAMLTADFSKSERGLLCTLNQPAIQCMVGALFGGLARPTGSEWLSQTEAKVAESALKRVLNLLGRSPQDASFDFQLNPAALLGPADDVSLVVLRVNFALGEGGGELVIASSPEVMTELNGRPAVPTQSNAEWHEQLTGITTRATVRVVARAAEFSLGIGDLLRIAPGDFIPVDIDRHVTLCANNHPLLRGVLGVSGAHNAIHILGPVNGPEPAQLTHQKAPS
ncbi:MAG: FliM/FliN family flagellar motor switch protein [Pseudomonadota bacterium]